MDNPMQVWVYLYRCEVCKENKRTVAYDTRTGHYYWEDGRDAGRMFPNVFCCDRRMFGHDDHQLPYRCPGGSVAVIFERATELAAPHVAVVYNEEQVLDCLQPAYSQPTAREAIIEETDRHVFASIVSVIANGAVYIDHEEWAN